MNKKGMIGGLMAGLMALAITCPASAELGSDGDFQFWNTESIEGKITEKVGAYMETEFRFGDDASEFYYQHAHLEIPIEVYDWLEIAPAYRQVWELFTKSEDEEGQEDWFAEARPNLNVTLKHKWNDWKLSSRNRFEYRFFEIDKEDLFRYRNKFTLKSPWKWTSWNINPFIADEIFIDEVDGFNRNRLQIGVGMNIIEHVDGAIYYLWQTSEKGEEWIDFNVIGLQFKIKL
jgi:hypothetical protein